jgi:hypothetical protein
MATWPATLPAPTIEGYSLTPIDPVIRTDMESGSARARRRSAARNDRVAVAWIFTDAQMATFRAWFDGDGAGGSAWFSLSLAIGSSGLTAQSCRFTAIWKADLLPGLNWRVTASLEIL